MKMDLETYRREQALEDRIADLEEINRKTLDAINTVAEIAEFRGFGKTPGNPRAVYDALCSQLYRMLPIRAMAIMTVDQASGEFVMTYHEPETGQAELMAEVDRQVADGNFAWSLRENRMTMSPAHEASGTVLLYPMASRTGVAGMLVAILDDAGEGVPELSIVLLSVLILICVLVLENGDLRSTMIAVGH